MGSMAVGLLMPQLDRPLVSHCYQISWYDGFWLVYVALIKLPKIIAKVATVILGPTDRQKLMIIYIVCSLVLIKNEAFLLLASLHQFVNWTHLATILCALFENI